MMESLLSRLNMARKWPAYSKAMNIFTSYSSLEVRGKTPVL